MISLPFTVGKLFFFARVFPPHSSGGILDGKVFPAQMVVKRSFMNKKIFLQRNTWQLDDGEEMKRSDNRFFSFIIYHSETVDVTNTHMRMKIRMLLVWDRI